VATCIQGVCGSANAPAQTPITTQTLGDCKTAVCDGQGAVTSSVNDGDVPADNEQCTSDICTAGVPSHPPLASGTACSEGTGKLCDGAGKCVECLVDGDCATGLCSAGVCSTINGCGPAMATDLTAAASTTINFGGNFGFKYVPKCIKVKVGSKVVLDGVTVGSFGMHPFIGGEVKAGVKVPAVTGPFIPITNSAAISSKTFVMTAAGTYPYYCDFHALGGMTGVVFVVP
jgi:hypothetical protein